MATKAAPIEATEATFDALIARSGLTIVDFWAGWCGPCVRFAPVFAEAAAAHPDTQFVKVDTQDQEALSMRFEIQSIPTLIVFRDSRIIHRVSGAMPRSALDELVKNLGKLDAATIEKRAANIERSARGEQPEGVPDAATWDDDSECWVMGKTTRAGKQGVWKSWRSDGTLAAEQTYKDDCLEGEARQYHEDGSLASVGSYAADQRVGVHVVYAAKGFTTVAMPFRQVAPQVARIQIEHDEEGNATTYRGFDHDGRHVLVATGEPFPVRPASLPEAATYDEEAGCFVVGEMRDGSYVGLVRKWDRDGRVLREMTFGEQGGLHGPYLAWAEGWYEDARAKFERGTMHAPSYAVGVWDVLDDNRQALRSVDLGEHVDDDAVWASPATVDGTKSAHDWQALSRQLVAQRRQAEALLAAARASGVAKNPAVLQAFASTHTLVRTEQTAMDLAQDAARSDEFAMMTNALLRGARLPSLLQLLCVLADRGGRPRLALDLIDAALAIVPGKPEYLRSRALLLLELGQPDQVRAVADELARTDGAQATMFRQYAQLLFPRFDMWRPPLAASSRDRPVRQPLDAVQRVASVYLTRLAIVRDKIGKLVTERGIAAPWLPPDVNELLPAGRVELAKRKVKVKSKSVTVDDRVSSHDTLRRLLAEWRDDWAALSLLTWAVGEDSVRIPVALVPRVELGRADAAIEGFFGRLDDNEVEPDPAHHLDGIAFADLSDQGKTMARSQLFEMAMLLDWLTDARAVSPWQADLRGEDDDEDEDDDE